MTSLIDRNALIEEYDRVHVGEAGKARKLMEDAPEVDAVPVIRCRDCKFLRLTGLVWKCQNRLVMMLCEPNDYCSRAERKEE